MRLLSCSNCCFNALQYDTVGLTLGYCVKHQQILRHADFTTCGGHLRKDLGIHAAEAAAERHAVRYQAEVITDLEGAPVNGGYLESDPSLLRGDRVGAAVADYGFLPSKIASLVQLREIPGGRAELAMLSLGRTYVRRCMSREGRWTSGVHLTWWTQERLASDPELTPADFRLQSFTTLRRQAELAQWSIVMLRLTFLSDIASYAVQGRDEVGALVDLAEEAAAEAGTSLRKLLRYVRARALPQLRGALPEARYRQIAAELHED
ncbi:MAG: hypothetical protein ABIO70_14510 [Pseudomonadota bacterium]